MVNITDDEFNRLVDYMYKNYGINLSKKRVLIEGRLSSIIRERKLSSYSEYLDIVFKDITGKESSLLINKLTTNHTFFMREIEHFKFLKEVLLPNIEKESKLKTFNVWSAGCSSGEEPYTIAMTIDDYFGSRKSLWRVKIEATDISMNVLSKAKEGIYQKEGMKDIPPNWLTSYFDVIDDKSLRVKQKIKSDITFQTFNLMHSIPPGKQFDLIFCRNVMIYFDLKTKTDLVNRFYGALKPGGYLFIGHAESVQRDATKFNYVKPAIYRKPLQE